MLNKISLMFVLIGFTIFHILEKHIYKHNKDTKTLKSDPASFLLGLITYSLIIAASWVI